MVKLHKEELCNLYSSPNIIRVINNKNDIGMACSMQESDKKCIQNFSWESLTER
jgi:hypothetical protein